MRVRIRGIEPRLQPWQGCVIAISPHPHDAVMEHPLTPPVPVWRRCGASKSTLSALQQSILCLCQISRCSTDMSEHGSQSPRSSMQNRTAITSVPRMRLTINTMEALTPVTQKYHRLCILALPPGLWCFAAANIELDAEVGLPAHRLL